MEYGSEQQRGGVGVVYGVGVWCMAVNSSDVVWGWCMVLVYGVWQ